MTFARRIVSVMAVGIAVIAAPAGATVGPRSVPPKPNYHDVCAPEGLDTTPICLRLTLAAIDRARETENMGPMHVPADFANLSVAEQVFIAIDTERVDRGLAPFVGMTTDLDHDAQVGADRQTLPPHPAEGAYPTSELEWIGGVSNGLDAAYEWLYFDGPGSGVADCGPRRHAGCWADRRNLLRPLGSPQDLEMGVGVSVVAGRDGETSSVAAVLTVASHPDDAFTFTWAQAQALQAAGTLNPLPELPQDESATGIFDPPTNLVPEPDYVRHCAARGLDQSADCTKAVLAALNRAHALEGIGPMLLPLDFSRLTVPKQLFVLIDLERVDRGLPPFVGLSVALNRDAQIGANEGDDPPDPGPGYLLFDSEWAGGSINALDAVYGWMYDDGFDSGNLDCPRPGASGCWGHRKGILDNFGSGSDLVMGAAVRISGVKDAPSLAAVLAVATHAPQHLTYTWTEVQSALPTTSAHNL